MSEFQLPGPATGKADMQASHPSKRGAWMPTFQCGVIGFILLTSTANVVLFHWPLYRFAISSLSEVGWHGLLALLTLVVLQLVISITTLGIAGFISIRLLKLLC